MDKQVFFFFLLYLGHSAIDALPVSTIDQHDNGSWGICRVDRTPMNF
jgi:hypothetical protein